MTIKTITFEISKEQIKETDFRMRLIDDILNKFGPLLASFNEDKLLLNVNLSDVGVYVLKKKDESDDSTD